MFKVHLNLQEHLPRLFTIQRLVTMKLVRIDLHDGVYSVCTRQLSRDSIVLGE